MIEFILDIPFKKQLTGLINLFVIEPAIELHFKDPDYEFIVWGDPIYDSYFKGVGKAVSGIIEDTGSGVDIYSCEFTRDNGVTWVEGIWNADHCVRNGTTENGFQYFTTFRIKDKLGNSRIAPYAIAYIGDTSAPVTTIYGDNNSWEKVEKTIELICDDNGLSGCAGIYYRINNGAWQKYNSYFTLPDGSYQIDYYAIDNLSNTENIKTSYLYQDRNAPITTDNSDTLLHSGLVDITLISNDEISGVKETYYCVDENNTCEPNTLGTNVQVSCAETQCQKYVRYYSVDNAGNQENVKTSNLISIDNSYPIIGKTTTSGFTIYNNNPDKSIVCDPGRYIVELNIQNNDINNTKNQEEAIKLFELLGFPLAK